MALAPWSPAYLMVGRAPTMRWLFVIFLSESSGTLKSTWKVIVSWDYLGGRNEELRKRGFRATAVEFTHPY